VLVSRTISQARSTTGFAFSVTASTCALRSCASKRPLRPAAGIHATEGATHVGNRAADAGIYGDLSFGGLEPALVRVPLPRPDLAAGPC
jgi:hypothetical protein